MMYAYRHGKGVVLALEPDDVNYLKELLKSALERGIDEWSAACLEALKETDW